MLPACGQDQLCEGAFVFLPALFPLRFRYFHFLFLFYIPITSALRMQILEHHIFKIVVDARIILLKPAQHLLHGCMNVPPHSSYENRKAQSGRRSGAGVSLGVKRTNIKEGAPAHNPRYDHHCRAEWYTFSARRKTVAGTARCTVLRALLWMPRRVMG